MLLLGAQILHAQSNLFVNRNLGLWAGAGLSISPHKDLTFNFEEQFRLKEYFTQFDRHLFEVEANYDPSFARFFKPLEVAMGLRYIGINDNTGDVQEYENHLRFQFDFIYSQNIGRFYFQARHRYQRRTEPGKLIAEGHYPSTDFRTKISFGYNFKKWKLDPEISYESFVHWEIGVPNGLVKYRLRLDTDYKVNKHIRLSFFYFREKFTNYFQPEVNHILGAKFKYRLKTYSNKKETPKEP